MSVLPSSCDVVVVGAGSAGSLAALRLARAGCDVVLLDRARFPRRKVCGACVGPGALATLEAEGLGARVRALGGHSLYRMELRGDRGHSTIRLGGNLAVSRQALDHTIVSAAQDAGATFFDGCRGRIASVNDDGVELDTGLGLIRAGVVVDAAGLADTVQPFGEARSSRTEPDSLIGAGAVFPLEAFTLAPGILRMVVGAHGYVGFVRVEDGTVNVAAALTPHAVAEWGLDGAVRRLLSDAGVAAASAPPEEPWKGTPPLTWSPRELASSRVFRIGDAAGYVEPFTGEGMAWALEGAVRVTPFVEAGVARWDDELIGSWTREYDRSIGRSRRTCRLLARGLRSRTLVRLAIALTAHAPLLASPFVRSTSRTHRAMSAAVGVS